jgi:Cu/Ag efflux pump CusA
VTPVQVNIYTESPGLAAEDVEKLVTFPVESVLAGLPKVEEIRSTSIFGLSFRQRLFQGRHGHLLRPPPGGREAG